MSKKKSRQENLRAILIKELEHKKRRIHTHYEDAVHAAAMRGLAFAPHGGFFYVARPERLCEAGMFPIEKPSTLT